MLADQERAWTIPAIIREIRKTYPGIRPDYIKSLCRALVWLVGGYDPYEKDKFSSLDQLVRAGHKPNSMTIDQVVEHFWAIVKQEDERLRRESTVVARAA